MSTDYPLRNDRSADDGPVEALASGDETSVDETFDDDGVLYDEEVTPEVGILGMTLRELLIVGVWILMFVVSFFPLGWADSIWSQGISWILPVGVPTVAAFLLVLRRFSPDGIRRVGSLGIDQFASVAFSVAAVWWAQQLWQYVTVAAVAGVDAVVWVPWVQLVLVLALVVLTVFAPLIPGLREDFHGRLVTLAHRNANPVRPVVARPRPEAPASGPVDEPQRPDEDGDGDTAQVAPPLVLDVELSGQNTTDEIARPDVSGRIPLAGHLSGGDTGTAEPALDDGYAPGYARRSRGEEIVSDTASIVELVTPEPDPEDEAQEQADEPRQDSESDPDDIEATNPREQVPAAAQPFWILAPTLRDVHDERGEVIFQIGPDAWALVIEDRGGAFVVRHDDGRIGYLHDIADITKG